jgi:putative ABC transport system permease protein
MKFQLLKTFWKISSRSLWRNKLFSFISIAGFTVGLTVFILLMTFVHNEVNYDSFHKNKDRIFRAVIYTPDDKEYYGNFPVALSLRMKESMPQIDQAVNYLDKDLDIKVNGQFTKEKLTFTDPGFFKVFSFKTLAGNPYTFGHNPRAVFVTRAFAEKYFGNTNPLGKFISTKIAEETLLENSKLKNSHGKPLRSYRVDDKSCDFLIEGIVENPPENTVLKFNVLVPFINAEKMSMRFNREDISPGEFLPTFFVMLKNGADKALLETEFKSMVKPLIRNEAYKPELRLYPIEKIHFSTEIGPFSSIRPVSPVSVLVLSIIGIVILLIVSINYINLTIAQSSHRFKEIGIRKVSGASRSEVVYQFIMESFFIILISLLISLLLSALTLPVFDRIVGKELPFSFGWGTVMAGIILIPAALSLLSGAYPAMLMSSLNPVNILKGTQKLSGSGILAKIFVTVQFVLSIVLISGAIIINRQYDFFIKSDLGYNKDNIVLIRTNEMFGRMIDDKQLWVFRNQALNLPGVKSASMSNMVLGGNGHIVARLRFDYGSNFIFSYMLNIDEGMIPAMGFKIIEGRNFSSAYPADSINSIIVNEEFVKKIGIRNPIGTHLKFYHPRDIQDVQIVGVVKNFHYMPMQEKILPVAIFKAGNRSWNECIYIKTSDRNVQKTVSQLKQAWEKIIPGQVFDYVFLDNKLADLYKNENRWRNIITYSSAVAIFFACMGLFGLVFFAAEKRTKEIGIRKVLGASTFSIIRSLVNEFLILIAIAILLGCSVTYYFANKWLKDFAYHIELNAWIFILAALVVTVIVITTLLIIAFRVASTNSVENLRYE